MEESCFFDCNCSFGMRGILNPGSFYKVEDLLSRMSRYGIKRALVYHSMAREYNPSTGNQMLVDEIGKHSSLIPVWAVMHHHTGEFPEPERLIRNMRDQGIRAVTMFPAMTDHGFSMEEWNCGELLYILEKHRIPLFMGLDQITWNELHDLLGHHPELPVIITNVSYRINRNLYALLKKFNNLHIETNGYKVHYGIEEICKVFGAHRLIFGSGMPVFSGASAVSLVNYARVGEKEKRMIAFENLDNLLKGVRL